MDRGLARTLYANVIGKSPRLGFVIIAGALVTEMVLDRTVDGVFNGLNKGVRKAVHS